MKVKVDENLGRQVADRLRHAGHDVHSIADEQMLGAEDDKVIAAATVEGRALVTNDLDFSDPRRYHRHAMPGSSLFG